MIGIISDSILDIVCFVIGSSIGLLKYFVAAKYSVFLLMTFGTWLEAVLMAISCGFAVLVTNRYGRKFLEFIEERYFKKRKKKKQPR